MSVKKMKDGRWYCYLRYKDYAGNVKQHKKTGFATKREAQEYETQYKRRMNGATDMTFREVYELYLEDKKARIKPSSVPNLRSEIEPHSLAVFGDIPVSRITSPMVLRWQTSLAQTRKASTVNILTRRASEVIRFAIKHYNVQTDPFAKVDGLKQAKTEMSIWTVDEFKTVFEYMKSNAPTPAYVMTALLFWTGMRIGEALALTLDDVDFTVPSVSITKTTTTNGFLSTPKTAKSMRTILLTKEISAMLEDYVKSIYKPKPGDYIFPHELRRGLSRYLNKASNATGVPRIRVHDLRHSHASLLINANVPPMLIAERLGHENVTTTLKVYAHLYPNKQGEVVACLDAIEAGIFR